MVWIVFVAKLTLSAILRRKTSRVSKRLSGTWLAYIHNYVALSYVWGPAGPVKDIIVNGGKMSIRQNLFDFLELVSREIEVDEDSKKLFGNLMFIDQICIDQDSISERNHQVSHMADIYSAASNVVIWIGVETDATRPSISFIEKSYSEWAALDPIERLRMKNTAEGVLAFDPYWSRLWIVQELYLAKIVTLKWGSMTTTLNHSSWAFRVTPMGKILEGRADFRAGWPLTWAKLAEVAYNRHCEDRRDRVYGLLGLLKHCELKPDYAKTVDEVFLDLLRKEIGPKSTSRSTYQWQAKDWRDLLEVYGVGLHYEFWRGWDEMISSHDQQ